MSIKAWAALFILTNTLIRASQSFERSCWSPHCFVTFGNCDRCAFHLKLLLSRDWPLLPSLRKGVFVRWQVAAASFLKQLYRQWRTCHADALACELTIGLCWADYVEIKDDKVTVCRNALQGRSHVEVNSFKYCLSYCFLVLASIYVKGRYFNSSTLIFRGWW